MKARDVLFGPIFNNNPIALQVLGICSRACSHEQLECDDRYVYSGHRCYRPF